MSRLLFAVCLVACSIANAVAAGVPPGLVGVWASERSVLNGARLEKGQAFYIGPDGVGAVAVAPPSRILAMKVAYDAGSGLVTFSIVDNGTPGEMSMTYDSAKAVLSLGEDKMTRRIDRITPEVKQILQSVLGSTLPEGALSKFGGPFEASFANGRNTANARFSCAEIACSLSMTGEPAMTYDLVSPVSESILGQARFALKYAREHKGSQAGEVANLAALLDSSADIEECLDLRQRESRYAGGDVPGLYIVCTVKRSPWSQQAVIYMGSILSSCQPQFCRYGLLPMLKKG